MKTIRNCFTAFLILSSLFTSNANPAKQINPDFFNSWAREDVFNYVQQGVIYESFSEWGIKVMYFDSSKSEVSLCSFHEGWEQDYKIVDSYNVEVFTSNNMPDFTISLIYENNNPVLLLKKEDKTTRYLPLDKKYYKFIGIEHYINDLYFTGEYTAVKDTSYKIIFNTDGTMSGINGYNEYWVVTDGFMLPQHFNMIMLRDTMNRESIVLHWEKSGRYLYFYELTKGTSPDMGWEIYAESSIQCSYLEMRKVK